MALDITVSYATPVKQVEIPLSVEASCTVVLAIRRSGILDQFPEIDLPSAKVGIYSKKAALDDLVHAGDRIEIYRPLLIDPRDARRRRLEP